MIVHCIYDELMPIGKAEGRFHPKNPNKHSKDQIERLSEILRYQGWRYAVKISKQTGLVTSGHGRVLAAKKLKWKEVPVVWQDYEDADQEYADLVADNAIADWSDLSLEQINSDIQNLGPDFDINMLGIRDFVIDLSEKKDFENDVANSDKFLLEVELPNKTDLIDLNAELSNRGYIVRIISGL